LQTKVFPYRLFIIIVRIGFACRTFSISGLMIGPFT
jgi:hypothetical protein